MMTQHSRPSAAPRRGCGHHGLRFSLFALGATALLVASGCSAGSGGLSGPSDELFADPTKSGSSNPGPGGAVVAELALDAPTRSTFVLHGTVPVPPGTYPRPDGMIPFSIRNSDGNVVPTQVEVVSRYASDADGADVLEVLGRVDLPAGVQAGQRVTYQVVDDPHPVGPLPIDQALVKFLLTPGNALLEAEDVFGNTYQVDLFDNLRGYKKTKLSRLLRRGQAAVQLRTYNVMTPATGVAKGAPTGALSHLFGVHSYITLWDNTDAVSLDIRVHNGFDGGDKSSPLDDPLGKVYFKSLELVLPHGWTAMLDVNDPVVGNAYKTSSAVRLPLIAANSDGSMHVMPHQSQFHRRLALAKSGDEGLALHLAYDEGQAFCQGGLAPNGAELYSWWSDQTARYFPQRHKLPDLSFLGQSALASELDKGYWMARTALETGNAGNYAAPSGALGWAHPWGVAYGGMTGGVEINLYDGLELAQAGTNRGWKFQHFTHRMVADRQPTTLFDRWGDPSMLESWVVQGASFPFVDMNFWGKLWSGPDPFGMNSAPQYQVQHVQSQGLQPWYEAGLLSYMPYDFQHYIRYTRTPKVLSWLGNDAIAKDDLRQAAEIHRMSFRQYPNSSGKYATGSGLFGALAFTKSKPNVTFGWGRGESWGLDSVVAAYSLHDDQYRKQVRPWLDLNLDVVSQGQSSCSGFIQGDPNPNWLGGQWRSRSSPEQAVTENALWGLNESVYKGVDLARQKQVEHVLVESIKAMIGPMAWEPGYQAPYFLVATSDLSANPYCGSVPSGGVGNGPDPFQTWCSFAYGYELTGDPLFLQRATEMSWSSDLKQAIMSKGLNNMVNKAALLALLQ